MELMDFKVGDKVKRLSAIVEKTNGIMTVTKISDSGYIYHTCDDGVDKGYNSPPEWLELVSTEKPKIPTHIVIWMENRDPHKLCYSIEEAKTCVRVLLDKRDVRKDSIRIFELGNEIKHKVSIVFTAEPKPVASKPKKKRNYRKSVAPN